MWFLTHSRHGTSIDLFYFLAIWSQFRVSFARLMLLRSVFVRLTVTLDPVVHFNLVEVTDWEKGRNKGGSPWKELCENIILLIVLTINEL